MPTLPLSRYSSGTKVSGILSLTGLLSILAVTARIIRHTEFLCRMPLALTGPESENIICPNMHPPIVQAVHRLFL
ncbi:hypothetical protein CPB85DRAFT_1340552, partial [Mucidula mucida]